MLVRAVVSSEDLTGEQKDLLPCLFICLFGCLNLAFDENEVWGLTGSCGLSGLHYLLAGGFPQFNSMWTSPQSTWQHDSWLYQNNSGNKKEWARPSSSLFITQSQEWLVSQSLSHVWPFVTSWTVACQAPLSMEFPRQEYWSGWPSPSPGDLPNPGVEPRSPTPQTDSLLCGPPGTTFALFSLLEKSHWGPTHT